MCLKSSNQNLQLNPPVATNPFHFNKNHIFQIVQEIWFNIYTTFFFLLLIYHFICIAGLFGSAFAGQGHEDCFMCHSVHTAKDLALFPESIKIDRDMENPHTGQEMDKIDALCMKCHAAPPYGKGIKKIDPKQKHPFGIQPVLVNLPEKALGFGGHTDRLACMGCHDPHPSNQNMAYLRTPSDIKISKAEDVIQSCLWCHPNMEPVFNVIPKASSKSSKPKEKTKPSEAPSIGGIEFVP